MNCHSVELFTLVGKIILKKSFIEAKGFVMRVLKLFENYIN